MKKNFMLLLLIFCANLLVAQISESDFKNPPLAAHPSTYWMWMNGNITKEGITADLEYMKRASYGGAMMFNVAVGIPEGKIKYGSKEWDDLTVHACKEANRLGLELFLHNSPGYSGVGGTWINPEFSMQQLVWAETIINSSGENRIWLKLPQPFTKRKYYRDIAILAYPSPEAEQKTFREVIKTVSIDGKLIDKNRITDGKLDSKIRLEKNQSTLDFELTEEFSAQAISIYRDRELPLDPYDGPRDYPANFTLQVSQDGRTYKTISIVSCPALRAMDAPGISSFNVVKGKYYRLITNRPSWISELVLHSSPRLNNWVAKTNYVKDNVSFADNLQVVDSKQIINPGTVVDITRFVNSKGELTWKVPRGRWTIVRLGHTTTAEEPAATPTSNRGLECDKLSKNGIDAHFDKFLDPLLIKLKPYSGTTLKGLMMDSWEAGKQNWTKELPKYFKVKRGYDIQPYLLALTGRIVSSVNETERFLWDFRRTNTDMFNENFLDRFKERAARFNLKFAGEPYGDGNFESLEYAGKLDYPMSEFWTHYIYGGVSTSKLAASTAHSYGRSVIQAESFTGTPFNSKFTEHPYSLKAEGDWMMSLGVNRFVYHTFAHQPYIGESGNMMTMGPFGTHLNRNSTWAEQATEWNKYNSRCAAMLQQGLFVADICILKDEAISSGIPDYDTQEPLVPYGYRWDLIGKTVFLNRLTIKNGLIVLPDGMNYKLMVVPEMKKTSPEVLRKLKRLVEEGMTLLLISNKPTAFMGLDAQKDDEVVFLANEIWNSNGFGKGKIYRGISIANALNNLNINPDFGYTAKNTDAQIHWIHRTVNGEEMYFVSNHRRRAETVVVTFRIHGLQPERWDAETGRIGEILPYKTLNGETKVLLNLDESGSAFVVFRKSGIGTASIEDFPIAAPDKYKDVKNTFSLSLWAKPETFAYCGRGFLLFPAEGEKIFGKGHATVGISMGQNGVKVFERSLGSARMVLESTAPVEGWVLINLVYENGIPSLYLNGKNVQNGKRSPFIVHPSLEQMAAEEQYIASFEGDQTKTELTTGALTDNEISVLFMKGLLKPEISKEYTVLFDLSADWIVQFPIRSKAPAEISMKALESLHKHADFNVKHFSGTATYLKSILVTKEELLKGKQLFLDLGRVENIAEVTINGQKAGMCWKAPYRLDVTSLLKIGNNELRIDVTNLYPNRMIGDESLPQPYQYDKQGPVKAFPDWYINQQPNPNKERVIFLSWQHYLKSDPLLEAGLLGPVRVLIE